MVCLCLAHARAAGLGGEGDSGNLLTGGIFVNRIKLHFFLSTGIATHVSVSAILTTVRGGAAPYSTHVDMPYGRCC